MSFASIKRNELFQKPAFPGIACQKPSGKHPNMGNSNTVTMDEERFPCYSKNIRDLFGNYVRSAIVKAEAGNSGVVFGEA
jgi:hypothetical protein